MAELLPSEELEDVVVFPNPDDENNPRVRVFPSGEGKRLTDSYKEKAKKDTSSSSDSSASSPKSASGGSKGGAD